MNAYLTQIPFLLFSATANAAALIMLKFGMGQVGAVSLSDGRLVELGIRAATNPFIVFGLAAYTVSMASFLIVLSRLDVSVALPSLSVSYILVAIFAMIFLGERINLMHSAGIFFVCAGITLIALK